jgi:hypothetical protein
MRWAERAWDALSERGYGARQATAPRESIDWVARLSDVQRPLFDEFFRTFNRKGDSKSRSAMRWGQLDPAPELARAIIAAAAQEATLPRRDDEVRKMSEGWLFERRWEGYAKPTAKVQDQHAARLRELRGELSALKQLAAHDKSGTLSGKLTALESEIAALCTPTPTRPTPPPPRSA